MSALAVPMASRVYSTVYPYVEFSRAFEVPEDTSFVVRAHGKAHIRVDNLPF